MRAATNRFHFKMRKVAQNIYFALLSLSAAPEAARVRFPMKKRRGRRGLPPHGSLETWRQ